MIARIQISSPQIAPEELPLTYIKRTIYETKFLSLFDPLTAKGGSLLRLSGFCPCVNSVGDRDSRSLLESRGLPARCPSPKCVCSGGPGRTRPVSAGREPSPSSSSASSIRRRGLTSSLYRQIPGAQPTTLR